AGLGPESFPPLSPPTSRGIRMRTALKIAVIFVLALALFIPVSMIQSLVYERQQRRNEAVAGIAEGWGRQQLLYAPYLLVPYDVTRVEVTRATVDGKEREKRVERTAHRVRGIAADGIDWTLDADVSEKARGLYKARLYAMRAQAQGRFSVPPNFGIGDSGLIRVGTPRL